MSIESSPPEEGEKALSLATPLLEAPGNLLAYEDMTRGFPSKFWTSLQAPSPWARAGTRVLVTRSTMALLS